MKTTIKYLLVAMMTATLSSCGDVTMYTNVNSDGSCQRTITFYVDSATVMGAHGNDILKSEAAILDDSSWEKSWGITNSTTTNAYPATAEDYQKMMALRDSSSKIIIYAKRDFKSVGEMSELTPLFFGDRKIESTCEYEKSFKWFYTDHKFTETFKSIADAYKVPLTKYVNEEEASYWFTGEPNIFEGLSGLEMKNAMDDIETRIMKWAIDNEFSEIFSIIEDNYSAVVNPPMSLREFSTRKDSFINYAITSKYDVFSSDDNTYKVIDTYFNTTAYSAIFKIDTIYDRYCKIFGTLIESPEIKYILTMPGLEAKEFKLNSERLLPKDYVISAKSRTINVWAFVISGLIIAIAIISTIAYRRKIK